MYVTVTLPFTTLYTYVTSSVWPATTLPVSSPLVDAGTSSYTFPSGVVIRVGFISLSEVSYLAPGLPSLVSTASAWSVFPASST